MPCDAADGFLPDGRSGRARADTWRSRACARHPEQPDRRRSIRRAAASRSSICAATTASWLILDETYRDFLPEGCGAPHDLLAVKGLAGQSRLALQLLQILLHSRPSARRDHGRGKRRRRDCQDHGQPADLRAAVGAGRRREGASGARRMAGGQPAEIATSRQGAETGDEQSLKRLETGGDRRLFRLYPPSLSRHQLGICRGKTGEDRRNRLPAGRLFRRRPGRLPALCLRQCRHADDPSTGGTAFVLQPARDLTGDLISPGGRPLCRQARRRRRSPASDQGAR